MSFEKKIPYWNAEGVEPPDSLKTNGFEPGYKPPAAYFNWFMNRIGLAVDELQKKAAQTEAIENHAKNKNNPHGVTASQINAATTQQLSAHTSDKNNPHGITPAQIGALSTQDAAKYDQVFRAIYGETSLADITAANKAGKFVYCDFSGMLAPLMGGIGGLFFTFCCGNDEDGYSFSIDTSGWSYTTYGGYTPKTHADSHKTGGDDAITPSDIGAADASHVHAASDISAGTFKGKVQGNTTAMSALTDLQFRNIMAHTADLTAGSSNLGTGTLYFVYE